MVRFLARAILASGFVVYGALASLPPAQAVTIEVIPHLMPNVYGSPSYPAAELNTLLGLHSGASTYGPANSPTQFNAKSNITAEEIIVSGFPSWLGQVDPGTAFGPAYANELGTRAHFGVRIDGEGQQVAIAGLSFEAFSTEPANALAFAFGAGSYNYGTGYWGVLKGDDGLLWTADDTFITGGLNTQLADGIIGRGSGNAFAAYCAGCTLEEQAAALTAVALYPGSHYQFTGIYKLGDAVGSGTFNVAPVPVPPAVLLFASGLAGLGFLARRRRTTAPELRQLEAA